MASRLQFSEVLPNLTDDEVGWLINYIERRHNGFDVYGNEHEFEDDAGYPDFGFEIRTDQEKRYAWFYSRESANVIQLAETVQEFLQAHRPKECFSLTWAETNTELKPGEFDGGAIFVTAEDIEIFHGVEWARTKEKQFRAA